jgi:uncharacterized membrane protein YhhN
MQFKGWLYGYGLTLLIHLFALSVNWEWLRFVTKPMLMIILLVFFISATPKQLHIRIWICMALFFSWLGDIFLLSNNGNSFIAGLTSFLLAHACYIVFFMRVRSVIIDPKPWNIIILAILATYVGIFYFLLEPHLISKLKLPVFAYALIITTMLATCIHAFGKSQKDVAVWCIAGAVLFVLSDSLLAINTFIQPIQLSSFLIMITYALAQFAIIRGVTQLLLSEQKSYI